MIGRMVVKTLEVTLTLLERGWAQGAMARNADGIPVPESDSSACYWCLSAALCHAAHLVQADHKLDYPDYCRITGPVLQHTRKAIDESLPGPPNYHIIGLASYNDHPERTKGEVLAIVRRALERAREAL